MKSFWIWFEHLLMLYAVVGLAALFVACMTGGELSDGELNFFGKAFVVWFGALAVAYILSPEPPSKWRRRR